jgi:CRISPR-associated protein (TIGR03984 family)
MSDNPEILKISCHKQALEVNITSTDELLKCLVENIAGLGADIYLLAFADDGVVWGKFENETLKYSTPLNFITLQTLHLFGDKGELRIWRVEDILKGSLLIDAPEKDGEAYDISYMLWGTQVDESGKTFSIVSDGRQGLRHAVPLPLKVSDTLHGRPLRITVRNFLSEDETGQVFVDCSRLLGVSKRNTEVKK